MKKIIEIGTVTSFRKEFWIDQINLSSQIEFVGVSIDEDNLTELWGQYKDEIDMFIVEDYLLGEKLRHLLRKTPHDVSEVHGYDTILKEPGGLWPHPFIRQAIHELIPVRAPDLDTRLMAYVTGVGPICRMVLSVLVQIGYRKINLVADQIEMGEAIIRDARRQYFGVEFYLMKSEELTLQPNNGTILVNTIPLDSQREIIEDLSYLNFIFRNGLIMETNLLPLTHQLLDEATNMGLRVVTGAEVQGQADWVRLQRLGVDIGIGQNEYHRKWLAFLSEKLKVEKPVEGPVT
ncbi:MAG: hypothetical protein BroJett040_14890 [Oligoflexia bacterium]|nr:MAG: hypothetical protein BroJett040_14890 [Oligoflexia bacterium]